MTNHDDDQHATPHATGYPQRLCPCFKGLLQSAYPRQNGLAVGLRELGRIERRLFTLKWLQALALRRRVSAGLNKGEVRNSLARAVFFYRLLVVAAITLWSAVYLECSIVALRQQRKIDDSLISHVVPLGWNDINLTGDDVWHANKRVAKGRFRPLHHRKSAGPP
ncbi:hypothetical protein VL15_15455 [Burkholderia cepacia]|uniref:Tn3 transposase DDE domain-containing protein n=1 Tax=Burkholderia cepacia TaxID=292 RepID=A0A0J5X1C7_BURCE|nr:hypothetical protein VL15_15455 [Burkholderia cepacia]